MLLSKLTEGKDTVLYGTDIFADDGQLSNLGAFLISGENFVLLVYHHPTLRLSQGTANRLTSPGRLGHGPPVKISSLRWCREER